MDALIAADGRGYMTAAAVNLVMSAHEDAAAHAAVLGATLAVPDGQPLVWALRALGHAGATRVYGPDLMALYCARAAAAGTDETAAGAGETTVRTARASVGAGGALAATAGTAAAAGGASIYLYGGRDQGALELLERRLRERFPGLRIVGGYSPPFRPLTPAEEEQVIADIDGSGADVVWVGTGQPKQEIWMHAMRPRLRAPLLVGVGAAFDFHAGLVPQAPPWMQRCGLEWTYRLAREPRRLWRRYARYNPRFVAGFARQYLRERR